MQRYRRALWPGVLLLLLIVFAGCGTNAGGEDDNSNPATSTGGPVRVGSDHMRYHPADIMQITVSNQLTKSILCLRYTSKLLDADRDSFLEKGHVQVKLPTCP